ncbi:MAG: hypothetical protein JSU07_01745 [Bacteroidetes bacterium]|nr:hypothetical protein [Bacteroidota bacterium]
MSNFLSLLEFLPLGFVIEFGMPNFFSKFFIRISFLIFLSAITNDFSKVTYSEIG